MLKNQYRGNKRGILRGMLWCLTGTRRNKEEPVVLVHNYLVLFHNS
jgi:hypothetical protein